MTPQTRVTTRRVAVGLMTLAAAGTFMLSGCDPRTLAYFLQDGPEIPGGARPDGKEGRCRHDLVP